MEGGRSYGGTSWADQWDDGPEPTAVVAQKKKGTGGGKCKQKVSQGFDKTKAVASMGMKKVKEGTSLGLHWIKSKYHKTTQKR